jgi:hypothetical protein
MSWERMNIRTLAWTSKNRISNEELASRKLPKTQVCTSYI